MTLRSEELDSQASTNEKTYKSQESYFASLDFGCSCKNLGFGLEILGFYSGM